MVDMPHITELPEIVDAQAFSVVYEEGILSTIERLKNPFDCLVVNRDADISKRRIEVFAHELVRLPVEWVQVYGVASEEIHDAIDIASVHIGRQSAVGDGNPMTTWHSDAVSDRDVAEHLLMGGFGGEDLIAIVVLDGAASEKRLIIELIELLERKRNGSR